MTWKTNPGCDLPPIKVPPGIQSVIDGIAAEFAKKQLELLTSPAVAYAAQKAAQVQKIIDKGQQEADNLKRYTDLIAKYADLLNTCPCALVWDDSATKIDLP